MIYRSEDIYGKLDQRIASEVEFLDMIKSGTITDEQLLSAVSNLRLGLGQNFKLDNVSFLLGNGCSIYAGSKSTLDFNIHSVESQFQEESLIDSISNISPLPFEEQLNALTTILSYYQIIGDKREENIRVYITRLKDHLLSKYVNSIDYHTLILHEIMLLKLRSFGCLRTTSFYTPNYDLALEYVLDKLSIDYSNGFSGFINRKFDPKSLQKSNVLKLIKIHGSMNWIYDKFDNEIKEVQPQFDNGKILLQDAECVLIYPTEQKLYQTYNAPYSELMRSMLDSFESKRNVIIVIGYKYGDQHINEILFKAIANPNNIFYLFDYDGGECDFIKRMTILSESTSNINIFCGKFLADFSMFVKYILPATAQKTDEEMAIELLKKVVTKDAE